MKSGGRTKELTDADYVNFEEMRISLRDGFGSGGGRSGGNYKLKKGDRVFLWECGHW